ncbi:6-pyruvoyl-tetrahydropterin synthase-related protein [Phytohalomonas tamaricis]|uniref:6-pyruvoyl-tetrahydropterin synthase-related protein n=1 Tax=Phytohalomonas tamaricis TaxID=2081032 RepID=UPI000D0B0BF8|nr:6-pyruvoyl-tetrahydropterin synthase-related protein [Phytohalomonas tamaricis]
MANKNEVSVIALFACLPLIIFLVFGYGGSDSLFHYSSWMGYSESFRHGDIFPAWDSGANYGLGSPRFYFYPPLSFLLGGVIGLILPANLIGLAYFWLCLLISGLSMYVLSSLFVSRRDQIKVALLYLTSYYIIFCIFTRFSAAEVLANSLMPLLLYNFFKLMVDAKRVYFFYLALLLGMLWITNIPMAIATAYLLGAVSIVVTWRNRSILPLFGYGLSQLIAIVFSLWYLMPAFLASKEIASVDYLFYSYNPTLSLSLDDLTTFSSGNLIHILLFSYTAVCLVIAIYFLMKNKDVVRANKYWKLMLVVGAIFFILQLPGTRFIWELLPMFKIIGFNFRFTVFLAVLVSLMAVLVMQGKRRYLVYSFWLAFFAVTFAGAGMISGKAAVRGDQLTVYPVTGVAKLPSAHPGTTEYLTPATAKYLLKDTGEMNADDFIKEQNKQYPHRAMASPSNCHVQVRTWEAERKSLLVDAPVPCTVTLRHYYFPFWNIYIDGQRSVVGKNEAGLITFDVSAGQHEVKVFFQTPARNPWIGIASIIAGALMLIMTLIVLWPYAYERHYRPKFVP